jgi:ABC-type Zn uptake system ZnuABC Zn-binding protein ZnuA
MKRTILLLILLVAILIAGCNQQASIDQEGGLRVMATTSIVADVVMEIGGDIVQVDTLLPRGVDPHSFTPTPQEITRLSNATLIFTSGAGLEEFLQPALESAGALERVVDLSENVNLIPSTDVHPEDTDLEYDHHTWLDPNNVVLWTDVITTALSDIDPAHAAEYQANAREYQNRLMELDAWIREEVSQIPQDQRKIVTDHLIFGYFAQEYGFTQVGAIIPGFSTLSEPSAQDLAELERNISELHIKAIFIGWSTNSRLADRIAEDTGIRVIRIYTHSLSEAGGPASNYLDYMRYNVNAIVQALR